MPFQHIVVKARTGRTWYAADSTQFWHTNAERFQETCDRLNLQWPDLQFEIRDHEPRKIAPTRLYKES